jgi:general secretion pathway protein E
LSSSLLGVLAQRLVRTLCSDCRAAYTPVAEELEWLKGGELPEQLYRPTGCAACGHSGYRGRTGIFELMTVDEGMRHLIYAQASEQELRQYAEQRGMLSLRQDGMRLVASGATSLEELLRVTRD